MDDASSEGSEREMAVTLAFLTHQHTQIPRKTLETTTRGPLNSPLRLASSVPVLERSRAPMVPKQKFRRDQSVRRETRGAGFVREKFRSRRSFRPPGIDVPPEQPEQMLELFRPHSTRGIVVRGSSRARSRQSRSPSPPVETVEMEEPSVMVGEVESKERLILGGSQTAQIHAKMRSQPRNSVVLVDVGGFSEADKEEEDVFVGPWDSPFVGERSQIDLETLRSRRRQLSTAILPEIQETKHAESTSMPLRSPVRASSPTSRFGAGFPAYGFGVQRRDRKSWVSIDDLVEAGTVHIGHINKRKSAEPIPTTAGGFKRPAQSLRDQGSTILNGQQTYLYGTNASNPPTFDNTTSSVDLGSVVLQSQFRDPIQEEENEEDDDEEVEDEEEVDKRMRSILSFGTASVRVPGIRQQTPSSILLGSPEVVKFEEKPDSRRATVRLANRQRSISSPLEEYRPHRSSSVSLPPPLHQPELTTPRPFESQYHQPPENTYYHQPPENTYRQPPENIYHQTLETPLTPIQRPMPSTSSIKPLPRPKSKDDDISDILALLSAPPSPPPSPSPQTKPRRSTTSSSTLLNPFIETTSATSKLSSSLPPILRRTKSQTPNPSKSIAPPTLNLDTGHYKPPPTPMQGQVPSKNKNPRPRSAVIRNAEDLKRRIIRRARLMSDN